MKPMCDQLLLLPGTPQAGCPRHQLAPPTCHAPGPHQTAPTCAVIARALLSRSPTSCRRRRQLSASHARCNVISIGLSPSTRQQLPPSTAAAATAAARNSAPGCTPRLSAMHGECNREGARRARLLLVGGARMTGCRPSNLHQTPESLPTSTHLQPGAPGSTKAAAAASRSGRPVQQSERGRTEGPPLRATAGWLPS